MFLIFGQKHVNMYRCDQLSLILMFGLPLPNFSTKQSTIGYELDFVSLYNMLSHRFMILPNAIEYCCPNSEVLQISIRVP